MIAGTRRRSLLFRWRGDFIPRPALYWSLVGAILVAYAVLSRVVKVWFVRRWGM
jgi:Mg2+-importing ATPase